MRVSRPLAAGAIASSAWLATASPAAADPPGVGVIKDVVGGVTGWGFDQVTAGIARWVLGALGSFIEGILGFLATSARPDVGAVWFSGPDSPYASVRTIAAALMVAFALLGLVSGLLKGDAGGMVRRIAIGLPLTVVAMVATTAVVAKALALTDALSAEVLDPTGSDAASFLGALGAGAGAAGGGFAVVVVALIGVVAALVVWMELLVRSALIYLLVALSPLAFATTIWPATKGVARRLVELLAAVIVSKLVVCIALATGVASLAGALGPQRGPDTAGVAGGLGGLIVGCAVLAMAAFSPFVVLRLMPLAEAAVVAQGLSRAPIRGATSAMATYATAAGTMSRLAGPSSPGQVGGGGSPRRGGSPGGGPGSSTSSVIRHGGASGGGGSGGAPSVGGGGTGSAGGRPASAPVVTPAKPAPGTSGAGSAASPGGAPPGVEASSGASGGSARSAPRRATTGVATPPPGSGRPGADKPPNPPPSTPRPRRPRLEGGTDGAS
ncbi:MAG TPA: hypothetical protein VM142_13380 [Acidimicrobiales bacterium]|nr:hypothetical protein [Acidimicrobiales bacterium]